MNARVRSFSRTRSVAIRHGRRRGFNCTTAREDAALVVNAVIRVGRVDLLTPKVRDARLFELLQAMAPGSDPETAEGVAVTKFASARDARTLPQYLRAHSKWMRELIAKTEHQK